MYIRWSAHSREKFGERIACLGINYGDIELEIKKQEFKIPIEGAKFKSIFPIRDSMITSIKIDNPNWIYVLTLWESSKEEVFLWKSR